MNVKQKDAFVRKVLDAVQEDFPDLNLSGGCFHVSVYAWLELQKRQIGARILAGSMSWRFLDPSLDDGTNVTHFSYYWSPTDISSVMAMMSGNLPEMHVWVILGTNEIVDCITGLLPQALKRTMLDKEWSYFLPPSYAWDQKEVLAEKYDAHYWYVPSAEMFVLHTLSSLMSGSYADKLIRRFPTCFKSLRPGKLTV